MSITSLKQLLDEGFVISAIIKVEVGVFRRGRNPSADKLSETLIILDITKNRIKKLFDYALFEENIVTNTVARNRPWKSCITGATYKLVSYLPALYPRRRRVQKLIVRL